MSTEEEPFPTLSEVLDKASERAAVLFKTFGWTWASNPAPDASAIRETYRWLAQSILGPDHADHATGTGRLTVRRCDDGGISLDFGVEVGHYYPDPVTQR